MRPCFKEKKKQGEEEGKEGGRKKEREEKEKEGGEEREGRRDKKGGGRRKGGRRRKGRRGRRQEALSISCSLCCLCFWSLLEGSRCGLGAHIAVPEQESPRLL